MSRAQSWKRAAGSGARATARACALAARALFAGNGGRSVRERFVPELETKGEMIGNNDLWIAAHAVAAGLTLITDNEREFRRVRGLKIQNWAV